jgi:hypothetical protein
LIGQKLTLRLQLQALLAPMAEVCKNQLERLCSRAQDAVKTLKTLLLT